MLALPIFPGRPRIVLPYSDCPVDSRRQKRTCTFLYRFLCWRYLSSRAVTRQVLSAQMSLTSVFGMGTGGPSPQSTPTSSIQASYPSLRCKHQSSLIPLYLLSEQNPLRWVFVRYICIQVSLKTSLLYYAFSICQAVFFSLNRERPSTAVVSGSDEQRNDRAFELARM